MRGIVLAGGTGSRLRPLTTGVCKQLLPVFDKPMIYYPLTTLMLAGIRDILVISTPWDLPLLQRLLGDGGRFGVAISYAEQAEPRGIAEAFVIGRDFLAGGPATLVLGDNLLYGVGLSAVLAEAAQRTEGAQVFGYQVQDPRAYGVLAFEGDRVADLVEKPEVPPSRWAVPGLYVVDHTASERAEALAPSGRGELEITDLARSYLREGRLEAHKLGRGVAWLDMGTPAQLAEASGFVRTLEARQALKIGVPEEVAWRQGWLDRDGLRAAAHAHEGSAYGAYLAWLAEEEAP